MSKFSFEVYGNQVLIEPDPPETVTQGGIVIPAKLQERTCWGTVKVVGKGVDIADICVGKHVYYEKYSGTEVQIGGQTYVIMNQSSIYGGETSE